MGIYQVKREGYEVERQAGRGRKKAKPDEFGVDFLYNFNLGSLPSCL